MSNEQILTNDDIDQELMHLVDLGLMDMGVIEDGEILWIPTQRGITELGMTPHEEPELVKTSTPAMEHPESSSCGY